MRGGGGRPRKEDIDRLPVAGVPPGALQEGARQGHGNGEHGDDDGQGIALHAGVGGGGSAARIPSRAVAVAVQRLFKELLWGCIPFLQEP